MAKTKYGRNLATEAQEETEGLKLKLAELGRAYNALVAAEAQAERLGAKQWIEDLRILRDVLAVTLPRYFDEIDKEWDRKIQIHADRHVGESKFSESQRRRYVERMKHEPHKVIADDAGVSLKTLQNWRKYFRKG